MFPPVGTAARGMPSGRPETRRSTGQNEYEKAVVAVNDMLNHKGQRRQWKDAISVDGEFEEIQRRILRRRLSRVRSGRAEKSLKATLEAISAFRDITGIVPVTLATAADCERFQNEAMRRKRFWRKEYPKSQKESKTLSANTVIKWSRSLQAAFQRANDNRRQRNASGASFRRKAPKVQSLAPVHLDRRVSQAATQFDSEELLGFLSSSRNDGLRSQ